MDTRVRRSCWLLLLGLFLHGTGRPFLSLFREERVERSTRELLRREAWAASALSVLGVPSTEVFAEGFDPFGEELKKQAPQDLKTPPEDAQVSPSGLKWKILKAADCATTKCAKPRAFDKVSVAYTGWQPDGNVFDSSRTRGKVQFQVGEVIRGWTEGLLKMNVGETARLWIPGDLAFGSEGKGGPPGDIVIDVSLFGLKRSPTPPPPTPEDLLTPPADAVTLPSGLVTKVIRPGNATAEAATEANRAMVEWYGWTAIDGQLFDASYNRAPGAVEVQQQNVPKGFWEGVKLMKTGETQRFWVPPNLGYGSQRTDGGPCGPLVFDVYLESFKTDNPLFR